MTETLTLLERFESKYIPEPMSGCWIWIGATFQKGYGVIHSERKHKQTHRVSWELYKGKIPEGLCVCHRCDNKGCVNPDHLFLGTNDDNVADKVSKGRQHRPKGTLHGLAKLKEEDIPVIFSLSNSGRKISELAEMFNVSRTLIYKVLKKEAWVHVQ